MPHNFLLAEFNDLWLLAQEAAPGANFGSLLFPFIVVGFLYYFIVLKPDRKQRSQLTELLNNLKKNDHVVTAGGIHGTVVNAPEGATEVVIRIDESNNTKMHIQRSSIARVITDADKTATTAS